MKSFKWLHFSDLHLSSESFDSNTAKKLLIKFLKDKRNAGELEYNYIFISGDIANKGIYSGVEDFMKELFSSLGINNNEDELKRVFWAVGNHDILRKSNTQRYSIIKEIRDKANSLSLSDCLDRDDNYDKGLMLTDYGMKSFTDNHKKILKRKYENEAIKPHRFYSLPELNLIVLNTCLTSCDNDDTHNIRIKSRYLREVFEEIDDTDKPIFVLGHHGRDYFSLEDMDELSDIFDDMKVDVYLCGHNHRLGFAIFPDAERDIYQITCGGGPDFGSGASFSFMHGEFDAKKKAIRITPYSYRESGDKHWEEDLRQNRRIKSSRIFGLDRFRNFGKLITHPTVMDEIALTLVPDDKSNYVNILHLSDLQFGITKDLSGKNEFAINYRKTVIEKTLINYLRDKIPGKWKPDVVAISGDLAWSAKKEDYQKFGDWLKKLINTLDIPIKNVILCTGNHDINTEAAEINTLNGKVTKEKAYKELFEECDIYIKFREFISFCKGEIDSEIMIEPLSNILPGKSDSRYLYGFRDLLGIRFNVLNTSWYCGDNKKKTDSIPDKENLWIGEGFVDDLQHNLLNNDKFSITVFHHPFEWLNPEEGGDNADVKKCLLKLSDIILCGHVHTQVGEPTFAHNRSQIFQSGALWNDTKYTHEARIIRVNKKTGFIGQLTLEYDIHDGGWKHSERRGPNRDSSYPINFTEHPVDLFTKEELT